MSLLKCLSFNVPTFPKYFFYTFSVYLVLRGVCTITWPTMIYLHEIEHLNTWTKEVVISLEMLIVVGGLLVIFGICGGGYSVLFFDNAKFRNQCTYISCITVTFASLFLIMLIVQSAAAIYMLVLISRAITDFKEAFMKYDYRLENRQLVNDVQDRLLCCGIYSYRDYLEILNIPIPRSCCYNIWGPCTANIATFRLGCIYKLNRTILTYQIYGMSVLVLTFTSSEFIVFIYALFLVKFIKERNAMKYQETHATSHWNGTNRIFPVIS